MSELTLSDLVTERRVMAAMITEPDVLAIASDVEESDFSDLRCQYVLRAIRSLQSCEADIGLDEIDHEIQLQDMERARGGGAVASAGGGWTLGAGRVADKAGFWFIAELLVGCAPYRGMAILVDHDLWWLRELATRRREISRAA